MKSEEAEEACTGGLDYHDDRSGMTDSGYGTEPEDKDKDLAIAYSTVEEVWIVQQFIKALQHADIHNGDLSGEAVEALLHPLQ
ncbi:hypothetical protein C0989_005391, partial [Termitomyces sp. Mn162]